MNLNRDGLKRCWGCKDLHAPSALIHAYDKRQYCSKGCLARARWRMVPVAVPRG